MSINTLLYGFIFFTCDQVLVRASAMSTPVRDDAASLLLYNPSAVRDIEPFEYGLKRGESVDSADRGRRRERQQGSSYIRIGRSQEQVSGYNSEAGDRTVRGRPGDIIRFGRSSLQVPHHKIDKLGSGFVRLGKSGSSVWTRLGRSVVSAVPSEAEMAILCPNILVDEDARGSEDFQLYLAKLMYICNNNNNGVNGERNEENSLHRNNLEFVELNGDTN